jgi:hypothetical protein
MPNGKPPPPDRKSSDSFRAIAGPQEEKLWKVLRDLDSELKELNKDRARDLKMLLEVKNTVEEHEEMFLELRKGLVASQETGVRLDRLTTSVSSLESSLQSALKTIQEHAVDSMNRTVVSARTEAAQDIRLIEIENQLRHTSMEAGKKAGLTWGTGAAFVGTLLGAIIHYLVSALSPSTPPPALLPTPPAAVQEQGHP